MSGTDRIKKFFGALVLGAATCLFLAGGYVFLKDYQESKVILVIFAIVWGLSSTVLLYYSLNSLAELLPRQAKQYILPIVFAGPALLLLFGFLLMPTLRTLWLSFFDSTGNDFVFLANYAYAFSNSIMLESFRNNLLWLIVGTLGCVFLGLVIAVLADRSRREKIYKAIIFMPMAISFVGAGVIWKFVYSYKGEGTNVTEIGLLNALVTAFGLEPQAWLQLPFWNNFLLIIIMIWLQTGYAMVIISASIKAIPEEIMEAARVDGASEIRTFFSITIPSITGTLITVTTTIMIFSLKLFDIVRVMTGGNFGTNVIANQFYLEQFTYSETGRASAIAIVLLLVIVPVLVYNLRQFRERRAFK